MNPDVHVNDLCNNNIARESEIKGYHIQISTLTTASIELDLMHRFDAIMQKSMTIYRQYY
jgi:hypothetical protein